MELLNKFFYKHERKMQLNQFIIGLGEIREEEDKFICYANQKLLYKKYKTFFDLCLVGNLIYDIYEGDDERKGILSYYNLDKPRYYIFDNIVFDKPLKLITDENTYVIFKNCTFKNGINIVWGNEIIFENNKYYDRYPSYVFGHTFLHCSTDLIKTIRFINEDFSNSCDWGTPNQFGMNINVENLEIINSNINIDNSEIVNNKNNVANRHDLDIKAQNTKIINSNIKAFEIYLDSPNIMIDDLSKITATIGMVVENENEDLEMTISNLETPYLVYNGVELVENANKYITSINKEQMLILHKKRTDLITLLKRIEEKGSIINESKINQTRKLVNSEPLKKVLKKD